MLDFVTTRWRSRFVTTDISTEAILDVFARRPFFLLLSIDAPLTIRWHRYKQRSGCSGKDQISLEDFVTLNDGNLYDPHNSTQSLMSRATVRLLNTSTPRSASSTSPIRIVFALDGTHTSWNSLPLLRSVPTA
jgi:dCMP deaminase